MSCDMTCAMKTEDALMSSSWLVCIFPEGALDLCGKEVAATRRGKKTKKKRSISLCTHLIPSYYIRV